MARELLADFKRSTDYSAAFFSKGGECGAALPRCAQDVPPGDCCLYGVGKRSIRGNWRTYRLPNAFAVAGDGVTLVDERGPRALSWVVGRVTTLGGDGTMLCVVVEVRTDLERHYRLECRDGTARPRTVQRNVGRAEALWADGRRVVWFSRRECGFQQVSLEGEHVVESLVSFATCEAEGQMMQLSGPISAKAGAYWTSMASDGTLTVWGLERSKFGPIARLTFREGSELLGPNDTAMLGGWLFFAVYEPPLERHVARSRIVGWDLMKSRYGRSLVYSELYRAPVSIVALVQHGLVWTHGDEGICWSSKIDESAGPICRSSLPFAASHSIGSIEMCAGVPCLVTPSGVYRIAVPWGALTEPASGGGHPREGGVEAAVSTG